MDTPDHKTMSSSPPGHHESHEVHLCHRCGWPFPNPHPSAKHRRAHKRVCGTIEGYSIIHSQEDGHHFSVSDDEHTSDDDVYTPSPKPVEKNDKEFPSSGGIGEKSNKSEEDVFSDAATEFADSSISPRMESFTGKEINMKQKGVESDAYGDQSQKVEETSDRAEPFSDPTNNGKLRNAGLPAKALDQSKSVAPITDTRAEAVSVSINDGLQLGVVESEIPRDNIPENCGQDADIRGQEDKLASLSLESEEATVSTAALRSVERNKELGDHSVSEVVNHDMSLQTENLQNRDASTEIKNVPYSAETGCSSRAIGEISHPVETSENDAPPEPLAKSILDFTKETGCAVPDSNVPEGSLPSVKPGGSTLTSDATEHFDAVSSTSNEVKHKDFLDGGENASNSDAGGGGKPDTDRNEISNLEAECKISAETVSAPISATNTIIHKEDQTIPVLMEAVDKSVQKSVCENLEERKETGAGASQEVEVILETKMSSGKSADLPHCSEADVDAKILEETSKPESSKNHTEKPCQAPSNDGVIEVPHSINYSGMAASLIHNGAQHNSSEIATLEDPLSQVISEVPHSVHSPSSVGVESVSIAGMVSELSDNRELLASGKINEQLKSKNSSSLYTDSESVNFTTDSCIEGVKSAESVHAAEVSSKHNHDENLVELDENSENSNAMQKDVPARKCSNNSLPYTKERCTSEDVNTSRLSVGILPSVEQTSDDNLYAQCSVTPNLEDPVRPSSGIRDLHETSSTGDGKNVINGESVGLAKPKDDVTAVNQLDSSMTTFDTMDGNLGSTSAVSSQTNMVVAEAVCPSAGTVVTNSQEHKTITVETHPSKANVCETPSCITLADSGVEGEGNKVAPALEIEKVPKNQHPKSDTLQMGSFPSQSTVVDESEGSKKNEEVIARSPVKQHSPLKNLLDEVKSPRTKQQVPSAYQKDESQLENSRSDMTTAGSVRGPEATISKGNDTHKDIEEWNSPARYPIEIKKEKKKKVKSLWVPFVCCSSVHRDL